MNLVANKNNVVVAEGRLDLGATLRNKVKIVRAADMASRVDKLQVIDISTIRELVRVAVNEAAHILRPQRAEPDNRPEPPRPRTKTALLDSHTTSITTLMIEHRARAGSARSGSPPESVLEKLDERIHGVLQRVRATGSLPEGLQDNVRKLISKAITEEEENLKKRLYPSKDDQIALLEKKVKRLATALDSATQERDHVRGQLASAIDASRRTRFGPVSREGIDKADPDRKLKLSLLKEIVQQNRAVRKTLAENHREIERVS